MTLTTVLFDLDGALLPMDMDAFVGCYFRLMAKKMAPHGYDPEKLMAAIWKGTGAMVANNGTMTNEDAFWNCFCSIFGENARKDEPHFEEFYRAEFAGAQAACGYTPMARTVIDRCKVLGLRTALATNPIFPAIATQNRIRWAGLAPEDFELITTYENSGSCKPNLAYYREILSKLKLLPQECLMVGNDVAEDMVARELGMRVFLLTPCLLNKNAEDISQFPHGDFPDLLKYLEEAVHEDSKS